MQNLQWLNQTQYTKELKLGEVHDVYLSDLSKQKFYVAEDLAEQSGNNFVQRNQMCLLVLSVLKQEHRSFIADKQFDLIKIDTQGAECEIMDGRT